MSAHLVAMPAGAALPPPRHGVIHLVLAHLEHPVGMAVLRDLRPDDADVIRAESPWLALVVSDQIRVKGCRFGVRVLSCCCEEEWLLLAAQPLRVAAQFPGTRCVAVVPCCGPELYARLRAAQLEATESGGQA